MLDVSTIEIRVLSFKYFKILIFSSLHPLSGQKDVEQYIDECKRRRRMSLVSRAKQHRRHVAWDRKQAEIQRRQKHRDTNDNAMDRKYAQLAKDKERIRLALETLRHPKSVYISNPFASLLE